MAAIPTSQKRPFIPAPGCVQVEMIYRNLGVIMENVYHVQVSSAGVEATETQMDTLAGVFETWESVHGRGDRAATCVLNLIRIRQLGVQNGLVKEYTPTSNVTGSGTSPACPGNVTLAIRWSTGKGGRSFRGRTYMIGLQNIATSGNQVASAWVSQIAATYAGLQTAVAAVSGFKLGVLSYAHNSFWRSTALFTPITSVSVDPNVDSQRRRLAGRGT